MSANPATTAHRDPAARDKVIYWAERVMITDKPVVFLDTETTGLIDPVEMVEISIIDRDENVLMDTLITPERPERVFEIGKGGKCAADFHHITPDVLREANAPGVASIYPQLCDLLRDTVLVIFNAEYDWNRIIAPACTRLGLELPRPFSITCAMKQYSTFIGDWKEYRGKWSYSYKGLPAIEGVTAHRALGDVRSTLALVRRLREGKL